ncbi:MAG: hypothetical protein M3137_03755 [Actinomycetota bacterium]|nr:hypothetical protein [Actinomycetota bacterium]
MPFLPTILALVLISAVAVASGGLFLAVLSGLNRLETAAVGPTAGRSPAAPRARRADAPGDSSRVVRR